MPVLACPHCSRSVKVPDAALGKRVRCPGCAQPFQAGEAPAPLVATVEEIPDPEPRPVQVRRRPAREEDYDDDPPPRRRRREPSQNVNTIVVNAGGRRPFPHGLHLLITVLTCGLWLPVWLILALADRG